MILKRIRHMAINFGCISGFLALSGRVTEMFSPLFVIIYWVLILPLIIYFFISSMIVIASLLKPNH